MIGLGATSGYVVQYVGARIAAESDSGAPTMRRVSISSTGGKISSSSGITVSKISAGLYGITHAFGTLNYSVVATVHGGSGGIAMGGTFGTNRVEIETRSTSGTSADMAVQVLLAKDVT